MTGRIRLVLAIHDHQPVGNFDHVFEDAYRDSYAPFVEVLEQYPEIGISLHLSGSLLEWIVDAHGEFVDRVRGLVERGQIEILGGPFFEPILAGIPSRDRVGQIVAFTQYLEQLFGTQVRGMWIPERVWEPSFTADICRAGIEYTILDDFHFRSTGLNDDKLYGYYLTEEDGHLLKVFPGSERLRYTIPFADPHVTIDYLRGIADRFPNAVVAFGDDGEKFGTWPGTKKHVYDHGWLKQFFDALCENRDWLKIATMADVVHQLSPLGTCYLGDSSYREMTEWALPTDRQIRYQQLVQQHESNPDWAELQQFMRGGLWRNFRVKYSESNEIYARMLQVSNRLEAMSRQPVGTEHIDLVNQARSELYRGQCNCAYWHGAFGGLYLPHLRNAVYHHLIQADSLLETLAGRTGRWVHIDSADFNLDARTEISISSDRLIAFLAPSRGGHLYELDIRGVNHNLLATLNRRPEPYHDTIREISQQQEHAAHEEVTSIHNAVSFKQPNLASEIVYDSWPRKSLVDHFLQPGLDLESFGIGVGELGDFVTGVYETRLRRSPERVAAIMSRAGYLERYRVSIQKTVAVDAASGGALEIHYELEDLPVDVPIHFGVEFNFAGLAANAIDRYFYDRQGRQLGPLETVQSLANVQRIGLVDEWLGLNTGLDISRPANVWTFPIQTVSQSEGGFELVHQSSVVMPHWEFVASDGRWSVDLVLSIESSTAQVREPRRAAVTR